MKYIKSILFFLLLISISSCGLSDSELSYEEANKVNLTYSCPLCNETTYFVCPECDNLKLTWCKSNGRINSFSCDACGFFGYPMNELCVGCDAQVRGQAKFWSSKNNRNHSDCSGSY